MIYSEKKRTSVVQPLRPQSLRSIQYFTIKSVAALRLSYG
jgi:hypothetical protein